MNFGAQVSPYRRADDVLKVTAYSIEAICFNQTGASERYTIARIATRVLRDVIVHKLRLLILNS